MINIRMADADFDLRNVKDEELFGAVKNEVVNVIKTFKGYENIESKDVRLNTRYTNRREVLAEDGNLYPNIVLDIGVKSYLTYDSFDLFIDPFSIKIAPHKYNPEIIEDKGLTNSFVKFMNTRFPKADYTKKRNKYFKDLELSKKIREELLFF